MSGPGSGELVEWESLFEDAACGLLLTDADGTLRRVNRTFCRWVGRPATSMVNGLRLQELFTMGGRIFHQTHWAPLLQMQGSVAEVKVDVVREDGSTVPMMMNAAVRRVGDGVVHDIAMFVATERTQYERELMLARKRAESALRLQQEVQAALTRSQAELDRQRTSAEDRAFFAEQMMGIVSHDLRNPLSVIHMGAELLERTSLAGTQRQTVERIRNSTQRANRLIEDLLDFTVVRFGRGLSVSRDPIDVHGVAAATVEELRTAFPGRELAHGALGSGPCRGDADRLTQALGNLVSNAMAYGAIDRPVTVTSTVDATSFSICVHNDGKPIPEDQLRGLFDAMTRGHSVARRTRSVGLGLFIVREICRAHGGDVAVESSADAGTTFCMRCPR